MEDVEIVRRLGRARIAMLKSRAVTSAARYRSDGYLRRTLRNQRCLGLYLAGASTERIDGFYNGGAASNEGHAMPVLSPPASSSW